MELTGTPSSPTRALVPALLYDGEPTLVYADGDTGKSLFAQALAVAVHSGIALASDLRPARPAVVGYLDWETSRDTVEERVGLLAAGFGIPPRVLYKRMTRPLVDEAAALAAEFARRTVGLVVIDSQIFALAGADRGGVHEPMTAFYAPGTPPVRPRREPRAVSRDRRGRPRHWAHPPLRRGVRLQRAPPDLRAKARP